MASHTGAAAGAEVVIDGDAVAGQQLLQRRKRVSYEHYDDADADGGPTPAPLSHAQRRIQHAQKRQRLHGRDSQLPIEIGDDGDGAAFEIVVPPRPTSHPGAGFAQNGHKHRHQGHRQHSGSARSSIEADERPHQLLPVEKLPPDFNGIPQSGGEYLALVRREALYAPHFTRAHNPYDKSKQNGEESTPDAETQGVGDETQRVHKLLTLLCSHKTPSAFPDPVWRKYQLQRFASMRLALQNPRVKDDSEPDEHHVSRLPDANDREAWFHLIHNRTAPRGIILTEAQTRAIAEGNGEAAVPIDGFNVPDFVAKARNPTPSLIRRLSQAQIEAVIKLIGDIMPRFILVYQDGEHNTPYTVERDVLLPLHSRWLFALLTALEAYQSSDQLNDLRHTARVIIYNITLDRFALHSDVKALEQLRAHCFAKAERKRERQRQAELEGVTLDPTLEEEEDDGNEWTETHEKNLALSKSKTFRLHRESSAWLVFTCIVGFWAQHDLLGEAENHLSRAPS
ncbi:hypothetical protein V8E36_009115 [Tilletia maclaganii]